MSSMGAPVEFRMATDARGLLGSEPAWYAHRRFASWSAGSDLVGWVLWNHFDDDDAEAGKQLWIALAGRMATPYDFVLDLSALESVSRGAYARIREFAATRKPGLRRMVVLIGDQTTGGPLQIGLYALKPPEFEWRAFSSYAEAGRWLGRKECATVLPLVEQRRGGLPAPPAAVIRLRELFATDPNALVETAARKIGISVRTLQRALLQWGTTYSDERDRARVVNAIELLRDPVSKLEAVAAAVGCADRRSLNRLIRRVTGESPSEFRKRLGLVGAAS